MRVERTSRESVSISSIEGMVEARVEGAGLLVELKNEDGLKSTTLNTSSVEKVGRDTLICL